MPEEELEYFLKVNHWLEAYPDPEKVFKTLVTDASRLVGDEKTNPIVDSNVMQKARNGEFNQISPKTHWKSFIFMFTPFFPIALIYMGLSAKMKKLTIEGLITIVPLLMIFYFYFTDRGLFTMPNIVLAQRFFIIFWIISLIYVFIIRKDYSFRKSVIKSVSDDDELFGALIDEYGS